MGGLMLSYPDSGELDFGENPILGNNFEGTYSFVSTLILVKWTVILS